MENKLKIPTVEAINLTVQKILSQELSAVELVKEHINRAIEINPKINALITIFEDEAIQQAKRIDEKIANGELVGKLAGIPFTVKDLYLVENTKTTFGSKYMQDYIAPYTSTVVQKCLDEGAVLVGKTNCDPWGFGGSGENSGFGPTKHPLDFDRVPGGSSSGSAASLLAGVGFFSLGTDTGGSVRLPASFCGLYGYKPTYGKNSRYGIGVMASSFDTPGFFTRYIEDTKLLEQVMEGKDYYDPTTVEVKKEDTLKIKEKYSIGLPKEFFEGDIDERIKKEINSVITNLEKQGHTIKEVSLPSSKYGLSVYYILVPSEISSNRARYDGVRYGPIVSKEYEENMIQGRTQFFEDEVKRRIMIGTYSLSAGFGEEYYKRASKVRQKIKSEFEAVFKQVDALLTPVSPTPPFKIGEKSKDPVSMYLVDLFTVNANIAGIPAISIPIRNGEQELPIGLQVMTPRFEEEILFDISTKIEML